MRYEGGRKRYFKIMAAAFMVVLISYALLTVSYIRKFDRTLMEENQAHLAEIAEHIVAYTHSAVRDTQNALWSAADALYLMPEEKRLPYLEELSRRQGFAFAGYSLKDGYMHNTEKSQDKDVSQEAFFQAAMNGQSTMTGLVRCILMNRAPSGIFLSVPICDSSGEPKGVLSAMLEVFRLNEALSIESFEGEGYSYIIDQEGNLVLYSKSMDYNNFFRVLQNVKLKKGTDLHTVIGEIRQGRSGMIEYSQLGEMRYAYYCPLGLNSWSIVNIVSKDVVTQKTDALTKELGLLSTASFSLFLFLLLSSGIAWINSQNQRHAAETKSVFLANMSHEIRTPMNVIVGMCEILLRGGLKQNQEECVRGIQSSAKGLLSIINDILDFSKIESGKFSIIEEEYQWKELIEEISAMTVIRIGKRPVKLLVEIDRTIPETMIGDKTRVKQILINLLGNAVKFTEEGFICLSLHGEEEEKRIRLTMKITDTGIGIKKKDMEKLFVSFNQVDTHHSHTKEGTGLGLAISRALSRLMGGDITVESEYGKGSSFTVTLLQTAPSVSLPLMSLSHPERAKLLLLEKDDTLKKYYSFCLDQLFASYKLCQDKECFEKQLTTGNYTHGLAGKDYVDYLKDKGIPEYVEMRILVEQKEEFIMNEEMNNQLLSIPLFGLEVQNLFEEQEITAYETGTLKSPEGLRIFNHVRILIVDDNQINLEIEKCLLEPYQMQVECAGSGEEALKAIKSCSYDLVFMDHMMPGMDGVETLKAIRAMKGKEYKSLPVVALTANATTEARQMFLKEGFDGFLSKPIDMPDLNRILDKWVKEINASREAKGPPTPS